VPGGDARQSGTGLATAVMQGGTQGGLAGGDAQQQGFGGGAVASQINQRGTDHVAAQFAGSDTHKTLGSCYWAARPEGELGSCESNQARRKRIKPLELKCSVIFAT